MGQKISASYKEQWQFSAARKVTAGLTSHWPCLTGSAIYPPTGLMVYDDDEHLAT